MKHGIIKAYFLTLSLGLLLSLPLSAQEPIIPTFKPLSVQSSHTQISQGKTFYLYLKLELPKGWHTYGKNPGKAGKPLKITWENTNTFKAQDIQWQPPITFKTADIISYGYKDSAIFKIPISVSTTANEGLYHIKGTASYLVCETTCIPKKESFDLPIQIQKTEILSANVQKLENEFLNPITPPTFMQSLKLLLAAFLGGLILNVMPCVFPILSLKAFSLVTTSASNSKRIQEGWLYTSGVVLAMTSLGGIALLLRHLGSNIGWGFHLQSSVVVTLLMWLMIVLGLYFLGIITLPQWLAKSASHAATKEFEWKQKTTGTSPLITGLLAVFVAAPCTAPFMATTLGVALLQPSILSIEIFIALGLGLASPYLVLCYSPALQKRLPKPGPWMKTVEKILSIPMLLTALWLGSVLYKQTSLLALSFAGLGIISIIVLSRLQRFFNQSTKQSKIILTTLAIISLALILNRIHNIKPSEKISIPPYAIAYTQENLSALKTEKKPILLDVTAAWCITCKVNQKTVIESDEIQTLLKKHNVTVLVADWTDYNPTITTLLQNYNRSGVPLVLFIDSEGKETILPQLLKKSDIKNLLEH